MATKRGLITLPGNPTVKSQQKWVVTLENDKKSWEQDANEYKLTFDEMPPSNFGTGSTIGYGAFEYRCKDKLGPMKFMIISNVPINNEKFQPLLTDFNLRTE